MEEPLSVATLVSYAVEDSALAELSHPAAVFTWNDSWLITIDDPVFL